MNLRHDIDSVMPLFRAEIESLMTTPCVIRRATGATTTDATTFEETPVMAVVYSGMCKITIPSSNVPSTAGVSGQVLEKSYQIMSLPVDAAGSGDVTTDDVATFGASPFDAATDGVRVRVTTVHQQTYATARRFLVEQVI